WINWRRPRSDWPLRQFMHTHSNVRNEWGTRPGSQHDVSLVRCCRSQVVLGCPRRHTMPQKLLSEYDKTVVASVEAVFKEISVIQQRQYSDEAPPDKVLFHYTSAEGLKGIIENNQLWATSAYYLNDSAEMFYGYNVLREVLDQWLSKNTRAEDSITLGLARQLRSSFDDLFEKRLLKPIYLTCFCEEDNLL